MRRTAILVSLLAIACAGKQRPAVKIAALPKFEVSLGGLEKLLKFAEYSDVTVSPDGAYIGAVRATKDGRALTFYDRVTLRAIGAYQFPGTFATLHYAWSAPTRVVIELGRYVGDDLRPGSYGEIYAVDVDGTNEKLIFGYRAGKRQAGTKIQGGKAIAAWGRILDPLPQDENHILVQAQPWEHRRDRGTPTRVYRVNTRTAVPKLVGGGPSVTDEYLTEDGKPRVAIEWRPDGTIASWLFDVAKDDWAPLDPKLGLTKHARPVRIVGQHLYAYDTIGTSGRGVVRVALDGSERKVFMHSAVEPSHLLWSFDDKLVAVEVEPDYPKWITIDAEHPATKLLLRLGAGFQDAHVQIVDQSEDGVWAIARVISDRRPPRYFIADTKFDAARILFDVRPGIDLDQMGATEAIRVKASDGTVVHAYLTLPPKVSDKNLPLIVWPHGGPHGIRDHWAFAADVQFFVAQGYAVLRVNFRGSGGYGPEYEAAGYRRWADRMIDDIIETTQWTVREGIANPKRIAIMGGSYGGFASAMAAIRAPDLYRCFIGRAGLYDMSAMYAQSDVGGHRAGREYLETVIGPQSPELTEKSPTGLARKIQVPVLLIHGEDDKRTPLTQAIAFRDALRAAEKKVKFIPYPDEGHGFIRFSNRVAEAVQMMDFLEEHLGRVPGRGLQP